MCVDTHMATVTSHRVGSELRTARERAGLSRQQLATLSHCSIGWLQQLEGGMSPAASPALRRIWRVLDAIGDAGSARGGEASD